MKHHLWYYLAFLWLCTKNQKEEVSIIIERRTFSSHTVLLVNRLAMRCRLRKPNSRFGWSSNSLCRDRHVLLGDGDNHADCVFSWHQQRPAIFQDTINFHIDSEYKNLLIMIINECDTRTRPFSRCPKTLSENGCLCEAGSERY